MYQRWHNFKTLPQFRLICFSALLFIAVSLLITVYAQGERSGFVRMSTMVLRGSFHSGLMGYTFIHGDMPMHVENWIFLWPVSMFNGIDAPFHFIYMRPVYPFLAAILSPILGVVHSYVVLNYLAWALAAYLSWRFTRRVFQDDVAGMLSVFFVLGGIGWITHVGDCSAHLISYMFYYLGVVVIYESRVWCEARPLRVHVALGVFLAIASLVYNNGLMLTAGYVAVSFRRNKWSYLALSLLIALTSQPLWRFIIVSLTHSQGFVDTERDILNNSLRSWFYLFTQTPTLAFKKIGSELFEFASNDSPPVIVLGLLAFLGLPRIKGIYWFFIVFTFVPLMALLPYMASTDAAPNYCVYGLTILLFCALSGGLTKWYRDKMTPKWLAGGIIILVIIVHLLWGTAYLWGYLAPLYSYTFGYAASKWGQLFTTMPQIMSITGNEPTPALFGGQSNLLEAGLYMSRKYGEVTPNLLKALWARAFLTGYMIVMLLMIMPNPKRRYVGLFVMIAVIIGSTILTKLIMRKELITFNCWSAYSLPAHEEVIYRLDVSRPFIDRLTLYQDRIKQIQLYLGITAPAFEVSMKAGEQEIPLEKVIDRTGLGMVYSTSLSNFLQAVQCSSELAMKIVPKETVGVRGWQKSGLLGRHLSPEKPLFPLFEIHVLSTDGTALLIGGF